MQHRGRHARDDDFSCAVKDGVGEQLAARLAFVQDDAREPGDMHGAQHHDGEADDRGHPANLLGLMPSRMRQRRTPTTEIRSTEDTSSPCLGVSVARSREDVTIAKRSLPVSCLDSGREAFQLVVQRLQADAEDLRGARLVVARVLERHQDQPPLGLLDRRPRLERQRRLDHVAATR